MVVKNCFKFLKMSIKEYLKKMKNIQQNLLECIDDEDNSKDKFRNIQDILTKEKIKNNKD